MLNLLDLVSQILDKSTSSQIDEKSQLLSAISATQIVKDMGQRGSDEVIALYKIYPNLIPLLAGVFQTGLKLGLFIARKNIKITLQESNAESDQSSSQTNSSNSHTDSN